MQPIAQHGIELCGLDTAAAHCEEVHLFALELLGVQKRDQMTETNRYPIFVNSAVRCVHYLSLIHI